ncbi:hypothetical protein K7432_015215, partial [Basidiobolus ranarum]
MPHTAPGALASDGIDPHLHHETLVHHPNHGTTPSKEESTVKRSLAPVENQLGVSPYNTKDEIPLEAYLYWASVKRENEKLMTRGRKPKPTFGKLKLKLIRDEVKEADQSIDGSET